MGHPHHGRQGQLLPLIVRQGTASSRRSRPAVLPGGEGMLPGVRVGVVTLAVMLSVAASSAAWAQGVRDRTRPRTDRSTAVSESQAKELTLTLTEISARSIQVWVRAAGAIDAAHRTVTASVSPSEGARISVGQRVRAFPPESKSSIYQARVSRVLPRADRVVVEATLTGPGHASAAYYVLEIVTEAGFFLSVPNEALIVSEGAHLVYVQGRGRYTPKEIQVGVQGELYTQVLGGVEPGEQVVTVGSFFIDAEHKLKGF